MRGRCPHCGEVNEYARPPTTAIVYCQHCRKPFGAASLAATGSVAVGATSTTPPTGSVVPTRGRPSASQRQPSGPLTTPLPPVQRDQASMTAPRPPGRRNVPVAPSTAPSEDTRPPVKATDAIAARVIVPKMGARSTSDGQGTAQARLVYRSVEGMETEFPLEDSSSVGRHPKNSIRLHDREVSKEHAVLERRPEGYLLRDLNSSNGTFVNNRRIREVVLRDGDELMFGSMRLHFHQGVDEKVEHNSAKDFVTILPATPAGTTHIHATLEDQEADFQPGSAIADVDVLRRDYDKLRIAHELSRMGITLDFSALLARTLEVAFSLLPADNGVILVVDPETGVLLPHTVKRRDISQAPQEIVLSSTIINQVINDRTSVLLSDAFLDPRFSGAQSIISQGIRSAMVVPLVANNTVYGVMHLDSRQRIGAFTEKDLQLLKALAGQAAIAIANTRLLRKVEEDAKTRGQLSRFLPPHVVDQMVAGKGQVVTKGGRECDASVLFCDIRGFTPMSEASTPQEIVDLLNDYFERLVEVVFERHGVLDKFIGDAMMAHWGTLPGDEGKDHTLQAVTAALQLREAIREFNKERAMEGRPPVGMGVGVNSGRLVAGYMGAKRRLEYTVIGDTVNTSSRLCGLAQGDQVLISEGTHQRVADRVEARYLGTRQLKGKEQGVKVYEVIGLRGAMSETGS